MKVTLEKKKTITFTYLFLPFLLVLMIIGMIYSYKSDDIVHFYILLVCIIVIIIIAFLELRRGTLTQHVEINREGVEFRSNIIKYRIIWEEVKLIAVVAEGSKKEKVIVFSRNYDLALLDRAYHYNQMSNDLIFTFNREGIIEEIKKYWPNQIINEN